MDISLPLCCGRVVSMENGKKSWVTFKYESLPNICYWCGKMDHLDRDCEIWLDSKGSLAETQKQFGPLLRAPPFFLSKRSVVVVSGFYSQKRIALKSQPIKARPKDGREINANSRIREELTVVYNVISVESELNAHLREKTVKTNAHHYSGNGFMGIKSQDPINSPQNPDQLNAKIIGINVPENSGENRPLFPTAPIGINPINDPSKSTNSNQVREAAQSNPNANVFTPNLMSREGHEVARVTKKKKKKRHVD